MGQAATHIPSGVFGPTGWQVPAAPATLHDVQSGQLGAAQQTLSTHVSPALHWGAPAPGLQLLPCPSFAHTPPMQLNPAATSQFVAWFAAVQVVAQFPAPAAATQRNPFSQATAGPGVQVPAPLQVPVMLTE